MKLNTQTKSDYLKFLETKIKLAETTGFEVGEMHNILFPHQRDIVSWAVDGGRRAVKVPTLFEALQHG